MRRYLMAGAVGLALVASGANAGGVKETVVTPAVVQTTTSSSAGGIVVPLLLVFVILAIASGQGPIE